MAKSGTDEHQRTVAVRKCTNGPCTAAYLAIYSFRQVIRADPTPVFGRKIHVSHGFANAFRNLLGCGQELHFAELGCNGRRLLNGASASSQRETGKKKSSGVYQLQISRCIMKSSHSLSLGCWWFLAISLYTIRRLCDFIVLQKSCKLL